MGLIKGGCGFFSFGLSFMGKNSNDREDGRVKMFESRGAHPNFMARMISEQNWFLDSHVHVSGIPETWKFVHELSCFREKGGDPVADAA